MTTFKDLFLQSSKHGIYASLQHGTTADVIALKHSPRHCFTSILCA